MSHIRRIAADAYIPTTEDVLRTRVRTSGLIEQNFVIHGVPFQICDVGGQRSERRKWVHFFSDVTAVIFVAASSEYDQILSEDETENRMIEATQLFHEVCLSRWFTNSSIVLFLNKDDIFREKIQEVDIASVRNPRAGQENEHGETEEDFLFSDYRGGGDYDEALTYIQNLFLTPDVCSARASLAGPVRAHATCALDRENVNRVFSACKEAILRQNVEGSEFME